MTSLTAANSNPPDLRISSNELIFFEPGDRTGSQRCIDILVIDDSILEMNETFQLTTASDIDEVILVDETSTTITIIDDDRKYLHLWL